METLQMAAALCLMQYRLTRQNGKLEKQKLFLREPSTVSIPALQHFRSLMSNE